MAAIPLLDRRLVIVTGKGGVGKSAIAMAMAVAAAMRGRRTLLVELTNTGTLSERLGLSRPLGGKPRRIRMNLVACRLDPREALEDFVRGLMPVGILARALLSSRSFRTVIAAAPGIDEFLALYRLSRWEAERRGATRKPRYDLIIVDALATGHSLALVGAPETFLRMVPVGPFAELAGRLRALVTDRNRTAVAVVATPEEMAVNEAIDLYRHLDRELGLPLAAPIMNAVPPERWSREEAAAIRNGTGIRPEWEPYAAVARFELARRRAAQSHISRLSGGLGKPPICLPYVYCKSLTLATAGPLVEVLAAAARDRPTPSVTP